MIVGMVAVEFIVDSDHLSLPYRWQAGSDADSMYAAPTIVLPRDGEGDAFQHPGATLYTKRGAAVFARGIKILRDTPRQFAALTGPSESAMIRPGLARLRWRDKRSPLGWLKGMRDPRWPPVCCAPRRGGPALL